MKLPSRGELCVAACLAVVGTYLGLRWMGEDGGVARVADDEIAIILDHLSGDRRVVVEPGHHLFAPFFQEVQRFDKSPNVYTMQGTQREGPNRAPRLDVRADDGSSFWFESSSVHYALIPERAGELLSDSGPGERFKETLVDAYARAVLRDEFGRYSAEEIVLPDVLHVAMRSGQQRMNELLEPHGVSVLEISIPKPRFDAEYEVAIERRKVADQTIQHLRAKRGQLERERLQLEARARKEKEIERRQLETALDRELLAAEREAIRVRTGADAYFLEKVAQGEATREQMKRQAEGLTASYALEAEGLAARLAELERRGDLVVRAALIARLPGIQFDIVPYSLDSQPKRVYSGPAGSSP